MHKLQWITAPDELRSCWRNFLDSAPAGFNDPYSEPAYLELNRHIESGTAGVAFFECEHGQVWHPVILRRLPDWLGVDGSDVTSPYGYGGPLVKGQSRLLVRAFWSEWIEFCRQHQVLAEFVRFHPLLENHAQFQDCYQLINPKGIVWLDLMQTEDQILAGMHPQKRRDIRKAEARGLEFSDSKEYLPVFRALYEQSMDEKGAPAFYRFSDEFFSDFQRPGKDGWWVHAALYQGIPLAVSLFVSSGETVHYFLSASSSEAKSRALSGSDFLLWRTALIAKASGHSIFTLGGGMTAGDSLFQFKRRFSPSELPYWVGRTVHDEAAYERIRAAYRDRYGIQANIDPIFFYRQ